MIGAGGTINDSYGVASITDNGVGDFTINWTQGPSGPTSAGYLFGAMANTADTSAQAFILSTTAPTATALRIGGATGSAQTGVDILRALVTLIGDH